MKVRKFLTMSLMLAIGAAVGSLGMVYVGRASGQPVQPPPPQVSDISAIARTSECATHRWANGQGRAPRGYTEGVALVFARAVCHPDRAEVMAASAGPGRPGASDALDVYRRELAAVGMTGTSAGADKLRYTYLILLGLGMEESSGRYCMGRYMRDPFSSADSAESGLFQTSWGAHRRNAALEPLFRRYQRDDSGCLLSTFRPGISCPAGNERNWGTGDGAHWQGLTKRCPAFAAEYAAVVLRYNGGSRGEFGPVRNRHVEISPACNTMLTRIQTFIRDNPGLCSQL